MTRHKLSQDPAPIEAQACKIHRVTLPEDPTPTPCDCWPKEGIIYYNKRDADRFGPGGVQAPKQIERLWGAGMSPSEEGAFLIELAPGRYAANTPGAGQSRLSSAVETIASTAIGYVIAVGAQALILPIFGFVATAGEHMTIAAFFTAVSLVRGYFVRRLFNAIGARPAKTPPCKCRRQKRYAGGYQPISTSCRVADCVNRRAFEKHQKREGLRR